MKRNIINKGTFLVMALALAWACSESYLDQKPLGVLDQNALSNQTGTEASLISAYSMLDGYNIDNNNAWAANPVNWIFGSTTTDDAYKGSEANDDPGGGNMVAIELYQWSASSINLNDKWIACYEGVKRANSTLNLLKGVKDASEDTKNRINGEAIFLRAYFHFELYKVFTNVPYYRESDVDLKKTNVGVDVVAECVTDVLQAVDLLPETQAQVGRINKIAAKAFLGKLYMYQKKYTEAKAQFDAVVAARTLAPCLRDMFQSTTENNPEALFSVQSSINDNNQARNGNWLNQLAFPVSGGFGCCGFHQPSQNLVNAYRVNAAGLPANDNTSNDNPGKTDEVDPRLDFTVGRDGVPYYDWGVHAPNWIRSRAYSGPYSPKKYIQYKSDPESGGGWNANATNSINISLIRLADVILMLAEAEVELNNNARALELVNMIRTRAGACVQGPNVNVGTGADITGSGTITSDLGNGDITWAKYKVAPYPSFADKADARAKVRLERRLELALEGHRFFDLKRYSIMDGTNYAASVLNAFTAKEKERRSYYANAATFEDKHLSFPLPSIQVELSKTTTGTSLVQNTGW